jgi:hypothetical protein
MHLGRPGLPYQPRYLAFEDISRLIRSPEPTVSNKFQGRFKRDLRFITSGITRAHLRLVEGEAIFSKTPRAQTSARFLHVATNCLLSSAYLFYAGYQVPSAHLLRHFAEACAMAMLIVDPRSQVFHQWQQLQGRYPVHDSIARLRRPAQRTRLHALLKLSESQWAALYRIARWADVSSHASWVAVSYHYRSDGSGAPVMGADYDTSKRQGYREELAKLRSAARTLPVLVSALRRGVLHVRTP